MMKKYFQMDDSTATIRFPERIVSVSFEEILKDCFAEIRSITSGRLRFDFTAAKWCDVFELSRLALWMLELNERGVQVVFRFPAEKSLYHFLVTYRFDLFLDNHRITKEGEIQVKANPVTTELPRAPFYPLTFFNEFGLRSLIEDLSYGNRLDVVLNDVKEADIVKSGLIRDVVLNELVDNVLRHTTARRANLIMTKLGAATSHGASDWTKNRLQTVSELEKPFFQTLRGRSYLALVLSDRGEGITKTLRDSYITDTGLKARAGAATDEAILEYAFLYHSTRRSLDERIGAIKNAISQHAHDFPPATGLYRLKEIVREFRGFLYVRSGRSIITYDFLNNPLLDKPVTASQIKDFKQLKDFGGTQYKVYFPITPSRKLSVPSSLGSRQWRVASQVQYQYLSLRPFVNWETSTEELEAAALSQVFNEIDKFSLEHKGQFASLILDCAGSKLSLKALHYLLFETMQRQSPHLSIVATNVDTDRASWQLMVESQTTLRPFLRPLLVFDNDLNFQFFGATAAEQELFNLLLDEKVEQSPQLRAAAEKANHLFAYDHSSDRYQVLHAPLKIIRASREAMRKELSNLLLSGSLGIFHSGKHVFLPSRKYCSDYFEIYKVTSIPVCASLLQTWYKHWLLEVKPDYVISISNHLADLVGSVIAEIFESTKRRIEHIRLATPINDIELVRLTLKLKADSKGVLISEVLGSTQTLKSVLDYVHHTHVVQILTVINATSSDDLTLEYKGRNYQIESVVRHPLTYYEGLPQGWRYSDVHQVDPDTHLLIQSTVSLEGPLWKGVITSEQIIKGEITELRSNEFLDMCVIPTNSILEGHFINESKHLTYLFNIPSIVKYFNTEIIEHMVRHAQQSLANIYPPRRVTHVLFPLRNPGLELLANSLSSRFDKCVPMAITSGSGRLALAQDDPVGNLDAVIIIDDAIVSGDSMFAAYDLAESAGAKHIFAYALIKRGDALLARRFEKFSEYGEAKISARYLADVELPTYTTETCPVCDRLLDLEIIKQELPEDNLFSQFVENEILELTEREVSDVESPDSAWPEEVLALNGFNVSVRWKLELSKDMSGMAPRKELNLMMMDYKANPQAALSILQVIFKEKKVFLLDENIREEVFYDAFRKNIILACRHFLDRINDLNDEALEAVFCNLLIFDEQLSSGDILEVLNRTVVSESKFMRCLLQVFSFGISNAYPGRIAKVFRDLYESIGTDSPYQETIHSIWRYWTKQEEALKELRSKKLAWYKELKGNTFHEIGHQKARLMACLADANFDSNELVKAYADYHEDVYRAVALLRNFSSNHVSRELFKELNSRISAIERHNADGMNLVSIIGKSSPGASELEISHLKKLIAQAVLRIYELISGENGVNALLEGFMTNVKIIAYDVLQQQEEDLVRSGIQLERTLPRRACIVFGEATSHFRIFQNLIENVWKNAKATKLRLSMVIDDETELLTISFLDDGIGIPNSLTYKGGLKIVDESARANCGDFRIRPVLATDDEHSEGFKTLAVVVLPFIKDR